MARARELVACQVRRALATERSWRYVLAAMATLALAVRLVVIAGSGGGFDLDVYYFFGDLVADGGNPYDDVREGPGIDRDDAAEPPLEFLLFAGLLKLHNSPDTVRVFLALVEVALVVTVGLLYRRPRSWRAAFSLFVAFNPLVLGVWTGLSEDKSIVVLLIALTVLGVESGRPFLAWIATTVLASLKWLGAFFVVPLGLWSLRAMTRRRLAAAAGIFVLAMVLANAPWFPDNLLAFEIRQDRLNIDPPIHASPSRILSELGLYAPIEAKLLGGAGLLAVYAAFALGRLGVIEALVLVVLVTSVFLPDIAANRILMLALPFLFIVAMNAWRWTVLWIVTGVAAAAFEVALHGGGALESVFGDFGTLKHVLWMNLPLALLVGWWAADRRAGRPYRGGGRRYGSSYASPRRALADQKNV